MRTTSIGVNGSGQVVVTDAGGATTRIATSVVGEIHRLNEVYDADDGALPSLRYSYDSLDRAMEARDAVSLQQGLGVRERYRFRIAPGARGEREDPLGGRYAVLSNIFDASGGALFAGDRRIGPGHQHLLRRAWTGDALCLSRIGRGAAGAGRCHMAVFGDLMSHVTGMRPAFFRSMTDTTWPA